MKTRSGFLLTRAGAFLHCQRNKTVVQGRSRSFRTKILRPFVFLRQLTVCSCSGAIGLPRFELSKNKLTSIWNKGINYLVGQSRAHLSALHLDFSRVYVGMLSHFTLSISCLRREITSCPPLSTATSTVSDLLLLFPTSLLSLSVLSMTGPPFIHIYGHFILIERGKFSSGPNKSSTQ